jgi:hypothetical protein
MDGFVFGSWLADHDYYCNILAQTSNGSIGTVLTTVD